MRFSSLFVGLALACAGCSDSSDPAPTPTSTPKAVTQTVGPEGGKIVVEGATVTFPAGALSAPTAITISATDEVPPAGYVALSKIYRCEPSGTDFPQAVTMEMTFAPDGKPATMFWSSGADPAFKDVGGDIAGTVAKAGVAHFSKGFVGRLSP